MKLNDRIEFPEILNMKEFMTSEIEKIEKSDFSIISRRIEKLKLLKKKLNVNILKMVI